VASVNTLLFARPSRNATTAENGARLSRGTKAWESLPAARFAELGRELQHALEMYFGWTTPLQKHSQRDINAEAMPGMENYSQHYFDVIDRNAPSFLRSTLREGAPVVGRRRYQGLKQGSTTYRI
jgi:hypothetical protein